MRENSATFYDRQEVREPAHREASLFHALPGLLRHALDNAPHFAGHLGAIEPGNLVWKDKLKAATRRIRLLAVYTPDDFKTIQEAESKERDEVDRLLNPTTQPTTKPAWEENESFKTDWHDLMRGIRMDMLVDALDDTRTNYYKDVSYKKLAVGGLKGFTGHVTRAT